MVVAIDLTRSVAISGPDGKTARRTFKRMSMEMLGCFPRFPLVRISRSSASPITASLNLISLSAHVPDDAGYFGERMTAARSQLLQAWKARSSHLDPHFRQTDILGALQLASEIFAQQPDAGRKILVIFSDMRQSTPDLNLESSQIVPSFSTVAGRCGTLPDLRKVRVYVLGADGAGKSDAY
jgi:hypothetical protein